MEAHFLWVVSNDNKIGPVYKQLPLASNELFSKVAISAREIFGYIYIYIVGQDPISDSKSSRLHVDIFRFCFHSLEVYVL